MARFYDTMNESELARVEGFLKKGGIGYYLLDTGNRSILKEIHVAEEDFAYAEELLAGVVVK